MNSKTSSEKKNTDNPQIKPSTSSATFVDGLESMDNARGETYLRQLYNQPLITTLTSFSHVANLVRNPYELINNVDEFVRQTSANHKRSQKKLSKPDDLLEPSSPILQEMDTFVAGSHEQSDVFPQQTPEKRNSVQPGNQIPIPALPPIECTTKRGRLEPLTIDEYETKLRKNASDLELVERVFYGGISCNQLRSALWPHLFGLVNHRGRFEKISDGTYVYLDSENNAPRWSELEALFKKYQAQWQAILPDQEMRFSTYRERKSLIERDVIRCDRLHPFYAEQTQNLATLTDLLMTYMMYDFDIGYVQGMSDLAGPILYLYDGDIVKAFWVFVEVMKLFRRNFEFTQKTIQLQLSCLYQLIKSTDPIFAHYLTEQEISNCYFAFRAIVCLFKRELMKEDEDDYSKVLFLWDTIWFANRRHILMEKTKALNDESSLNDFEQLVQENNEGKAKPITEQPKISLDPFKTTIDSDQSDTPRHTLTETEIFVLALCLSMIRRERDLVIANQLDSTDIHRHFIDPKLAGDLNGFLEHAINIYSYLKNDFDISKLTVQSKPSSHEDTKPESPIGSAECYDLLSDFLIINGASGT